MGYDTWRWGCAQTSFMKASLARATCLGWVKKPTIPDKPLTVRPVHLYILSRNPPVKVTAQVQIILDSWLRDRNNDI